MPTVTLLIPLDRALHPVLLLNVCGMLVCRRCERRGRADGRDDWSRNASRRWRPNAEDDGGTFVR